MLSEQERVAFEQIVRGLGPLPAPGSNAYLMPWWLPPAVLLCYGPLLLALAVGEQSAVCCVLGVVATVLSCRWALHRRRMRAPGPGFGLSAPPRWLD